MMDWYYANNGQRSGPVSAEEFARLVRRGTVRDDTLVWKADMTEWQSWREVAPTVALPDVADEPPPLAPQVPSSFGGEVATVDPGVEYGGFWLRLLAKIIDGIALMVIGNLASGLLLGGRLAELQQVDPEDPAAAALVFGTLGWLVLIGTLIGLLYNWFFLARFAATPGKLALGLRVLRPDGSRLSHGRIVGRYFAEYISTFTFYIGYLIAAFDDQKRALHDYLCDTRVMKRR